MRTERVLKYDLLVLMLAFYVEGIALDGPGLIRAQNGSSVSLLWTSDMDVSYQAYYIRVNITDVCIFLPPFHFFVLHSDFTGITSPDIGTNHLGIRINPVDTRHAHQYNIVYFEEIFDENATIYVYDEPSTPELKIQGDSHEGIQFTLQCHAASTSLPAANRLQVSMVYIWRNNSVGLDPGDLPDRYSITSSGDPANAVNDLLVITDLSRHDAGSYACTAHEDGSDFQSLFSNIYDLEPLYAPGRALSGADKTADMGDDITLSCSADDHGHPGGSWTWTRPGGTVVNTSDVGQLTIIRVTVMSDDGQYSCHLNNQVGDGARGYMTVTVQEMPMLDVIENVSLKHSDLLNVSCEARARPQCDVTWQYANGFSLPSSVFTWTSSQRPDGKYTMTTNYLHWTAGSSPDDRRHKGGGITCVTSNVVGDTTTDFIMVVQFAPYNVQVNLSTEIIEYERLRPVLCSAVCNPPCTYSWYNEGAQVSSNAELVIHNVTRDGHGVYECRPDNGIPGGQTADFDLTVFYGPSVNIFHLITPSGLIYKHDDVTFSCQTDSRPNPVITLIRPSGDTLVSSSTSSTLEHTLTDIDCLDSGVYRCVVSNSFTRIQRSKLLAVAVRCPPRKFLTSDTRVAAAEGDTVIFTIAIIAFPEPTITWNMPPKGDIPQVIGSAQYSSDACVTSTLMIHNLTQEEFGNYSVTASNPAGVMKDEFFSLSAADRPNVPSRLVVHHANAVSITMQWIPGWNRGAEQVFTFMYRRSDSSDSYTSITDISDPGQGETVTAKAVGLLPDTSYDFMVRATNRFGSIKTKSKTALSAIAPLINTEDRFSVAISGNTATIKWPLRSYSGPITHVDVNSCDVNSARCLITTFLNITSAVEITVPEGGASYTFVFRVYDGEDLLLNVNHFIQLDTGPSTGLVVGVVVTVVLLCAAVTFIGVITWRGRRRRRRKKNANKGEKAKQRNVRQMCDSRPDKNYVNDSPREWEVSDNPRTEQEQSPYEQIEDSARSTLSTPSVYERPRTPQSAVVPAVYETLHIVDSSPTAVQADNLELSEYANMA